MYKRYSREQLQNYGWGFLSNLKRVLVQENSIHIKDFLKQQFALGVQTQYRDGTEPLFRFIYHPAASDGSPSYTLIDEKEKIELLVDTSTLWYLHNTLKSSKKPIQWESLLTKLFDEYQQWQHRTINGRPYIVYDIETLYATNDLTNLAFQLWYTLTSSDHQEQFEQNYKYIEASAIKKYVDYLLAFDGYIIWFNTIGFDNKVVAYNAWYGEEVVAQLEEKSIDIFYYLRNLTGKRMWLNKIATALIGLQKTLAWGWSEWSELLKDRVHNNNEQSLKKVKEYCKWDVKMTLWILLYLYVFWEFFIDWEQYIFDELSFIRMGREIKSWTIKKNPISSSWANDWLF